MRTTEKYNDGLEWLRELRRKIAVECGYDLAKQADYYREVAARIPHRSYRPAAGKKRAARKMAHQS